MKYTILSLAFCLLSTAIFAQQHANYETIKSNTPDEVIYKGECTFADIGNVKAFNLKANAAAYSPDEQSVQTLKENLKKYKLVVFLGTWCDDSQDMIPKLYRVLQDANYPIPKIFMYAVDKDKKGRNGEEKKYTVANVPTVIVFDGDKEIGRITERAEKTVEKDLADIITNHQ